MLLHTHKSDENYSVDEDVKWQESLHTAEGTVN